MKYKLLGKTGIRVSELCLGTMTFGGEKTMGSDKAESKKVFDTFLNAGGNFFDTANIYTLGASETILGDFIQSERENLVIASKYSLTEEKHPNLAGNHRKNMMQSIDGSLKRLKTDYIDLYYIHAWDYTVHPEELMRNLDYLLASGKVLSIGISDTPAWIVAQCNTIANTRGWTPFSAYQVEYCMSEHTADREIIPCSIGFDMTFCGFGPLGAGLLTGKYLKEESTEPRRMKQGISHRLSKENLHLSQQLLNMAKDLGHTPSQLAIRWAMQKSPNSCPIFGARTEKHCIENLGALDFVLTEEQMNQLNSICEIGPNNPNDFLQLPRVKEILYGGHIDKIEF